ncbi:type II toxin-antitoxin system HigA family antitoxin [Silanimonas sp.]|jgi:HTH-type transcriptional regulator/antitoxin HigA|uniref:helix-turn-helix domain-containing protein n=1 Tax=Silanimonas sp. TaxID=1929290 RepID=UPI0022CABED9|nr:transcriptional regulator [Silanimonas sp.]MCZ8061850.1 transcriptional regulator [Silanimonas sp.]
MDIRPIRTKADHKAALREISALMEADPKRGTAEFDKLDILVTLVDAYEEKRHAIAPPDPIEAIRFRMEQLGLTAKDLAVSIGQTNRVYEVLNHKRSLTVPMIRKLYAQLGIPAEILIRESEQA